MNLLKITAIILSLASINAHIYAGIIRGNNVNFSAGTTFNADGEITGEQSVNLTAGEVFNGKGLIKAPKI